MNNQRLSREVQRLNSLFERVSSAASGDDNLQSHWARYLTVLVSGYLETAISEIYTEFAKRSASKPVSNFTGIHLARIQNPNSERFIVTAGSFKDDWRVNLVEFLNEGGRKEAIDSIINIRHIVAHGKDVGITIYRIKEYYRKSIEVLEFIEQQCGS